MPRWNESGDGEGLTSNFTERFIRHRCDRDSLRGIPMRIRWAAKQRGNITLCMPSQKRKPTISNWQAFWTSQRAARDSAGVNAARVCAENCET
ncbi:hypothetical protein N7497_003779 [Penicillium chrysogenum]|nr:hypothetical protein N7497_003779 [Penicillium chrysogenum]